MLTGGSVKFLGLVSQTRTQSTLVATNNGQMKSDGCRRFSASIARIHGLDRPRRMRR